MQKIIFFLIASCNFMGLAASEKQEGKLLTKEHGVYSLTYVTVEMLQNNPQEALIKLQMIQNKDSQIVKSVHGVQCPYNKTVCELISELEKKQKTLS